MKLKIFILISILIILSGCSVKYAVPIEDQDNSTITLTTKNSNMYNNVIVDRTFETNYTEICFKNGSTQKDIHVSNESTQGGNCLPGDTGFIIEKLERNPETWEFAKQTCLQQDMRLPTEWEYKISCRQRASFDLFFMVNNWEWTSNNAYPNSPRIESSIMGDGGCNFGDGGLVATTTGGEATYHFRCVR